jgi:hypothetical protein
MTEQKMSPIAQAFVAIAKIVSAAVIVLTLTIK